MKIQILMLGIVMILLISGCNKYQVTCYDAGSPELVKTWIEEQPNIGFAKDNAMRLCHNGINNIVIKVNKIG